MKSTKLRNKLLKPTKYQHYKIPTFHNSKSLIRALAKTSITFIQNQPLFNITSPQDKTESQNTVKNNLQATSFTISMRYTRVYQHSLETDEICFQMPTFHKSKSLIQVLANTPIKPMQNQHVLNITIP